MARNASLVSRRNILLGFGGTVAVGAVALQGTNGASPLAQLLQPAGHQAGPLASGNYAAWRSQVGSSFVANTGHVLKLAGVQPYPRDPGRPGNVRERAFVARFDVIKGGMLAEGLYSFAHEVGGTFDMRLSSAGPDKPLRLLAIFD